MKIRSLVIGILVLVYSSLSYGSENSSEIKQIEKLLTNFQAAIEEKDEDTFLDLFYDHTVVFLGVNPAKRKGEKPSNNGLMYATHVGFIGWIAATPKDVKEKVWDINIQTDGNIAAVYFKYSFHIDEKRTNYGDETWSLIKTTEGWKIASILYSAIYE